MNLHTEANSKESSGNGENSETSTVVSARSSRRSDTEVSHSSKSKSGNPKSGTILKKPKYNSGNKIEQVEKFRPEKKKKKIDPEKSVSKKVIIKPKALDYELESVLLYRAIDTKEWKLATRCLKADPNEAQIWVYRLDKKGEVLWKFLPLHAACFSGAPGDLVKELVSAYPESVKCKVHGSKLPIHIACETGAHRDVVVSLLEEYPDSLCALDCNGKTPLELCKSGSNKNKAQIMKILTKRSRSKDTLGGKPKRLTFFGR